jgi:hypothetical protein
LVRAQPVQVTSLIYIGSTTQTLSQRWTDHKKNCSVEKYQYEFLYKKITELGKNNFYIELYLYRIKTNMRKSLKNIKMNIRNQSLNKEKYREKNIDKLKLIKSKLITCI